MSGLFRKELVGYRLSPGSLVNSRWVEGAKTLFTTNASVQPTTPHDVLFLEEGRRMRKSYTLFTDDVYTVLTATKNPDRIVIDNEEYEVDVSAPWQNNVISHYKYIVTKLGAIES